jgi:hypothetical protein
MPSIAAAAQTAFKDHDFISTLSLFNAAGLTARPPVDQLL